jgi:citrate lyase gamma subunit
MAEENIGGFLGAIEKLKAGLKDEGLVGAFDNLSQGIQNINNGFLESRTRVLEFSTALSDSVAGITRLGGDLTATQETISNIAVASRRNVVETSQTVQEIYATAKLLGQSADYLVQDFVEVGNSIENIGEITAESIQYIQSMGLNAKEIMGDVTRNMGYMNRFNFQDGVMGLTKMAAQASMLRFDMNQTAQLADKAMDPEGAIELASAFQRLGVTMGTLVDPFALMDASINDPGKLQDSVIDLAKTYAQFDKETQRFEINPYGIRMLREVEKQTGLSAENLKKTALAALELDTRLSDINFSIDASEEDKMMIANIAKKKDGDYVVRIFDEQKGEIDVKLSELTSQQFSKLIEQQEQEPKTIEEIQRSQFRVSEKMAMDTAAIKNYFLYGLAGQTGFRRVFEDLGTIYDDVSTSLNKAVPTQQDMRTMFEGVGNSLRETVIDAISTQDPAKIENALNELAKQKDDIPTKSVEIMKSFLSELGTNMPKESLSAVGVGYKELTDAIRSLTKVSEKTQTINGDFNLDGTISVNVQTPGVDPKQVQALFRDREFQNLLHQIIRERAAVEIKALNR